MSQMAHATSHTRSAINHTLTVTAQTTLTPRRFFIDCSMVASRSLYDVSATMFYTMPHQTALSHHSRDKEATISFLPSARMQYGQRSPCCTFMQHHNCQMWHNWCSMLHQYNTNTLAAGLSDLDTGQALSPFTALLPHPQ